MCASFLLSNIFGESAYLVKVCSGKSVSVCLLPNLQLFLNNWGFYCKTHSTTGRCLCCFVDCICLILAFRTAFKGKDRVLQLVMVWSGSSLCCICQGIESEGTLGLSRACLTAAALLLIDNSARMKGIVSGVCSTGDMLCSYQVFCISESAYLGLLLLVFVTASAYRGEIAVVCSHTDILGLSKPLICVFDPNCEWWDRCSPDLSRAE